MADRPISKSVYFNSPEAKAVLQWGVEEVKNLRMPSFSSFMVKLLFDEYERQNGGNEVTPGNGRTVVLLQQIQEQLSRVEAQLNNGVTAEQYAAAKQPVQAIATQVIDSTSLDDFIGETQWG